MSGRAGMRMSDASRKKQSLARKGKKHDPSTIEKMKKTIARKRKARLDSTKRVALTLKDPPPND